MSSIWMAITQSKMLWVAPHVDDVLIDSGNQRLTVKLLGGTWRTHDCTISRRIVDQVNKPVFLAGKLTAEIVRSAVEEVRPFRVEINSDVRTVGRLDQRSRRFY